MSGPYAGNGSLRPTPYAGPSAVDLAFGGGWIPSSASGLVLWLRADTGISGNIVSWADQSPTGALFTTPGVSPTVNSASINGQKGIAFAAASLETLNANHSAAWNLATFTMVLVLKPTSAFTGFEAPLNKASSGAWADGYGFYFNGGGSLFGWSGNFSSGSINFGTLALGSPYVAVYEWDGATSTARLNGVAIGSGVSGARVDNSSPLNVGFGPGGTYFSGDIDEIIIWNNKISAGDLASLGMYTTARYGINA